MMKLTERQREAYDKLSETEWKSAYELKTSLATLGALVSKGLAKSKHGAGSFSSPQTGILYRKLRDDEL